MSDCQKYKNKTNLLNNHNIHMASNKLQNNVLGTKVLKHVITREQTALRIQYVKFVLGFGI